MNQILLFTVLATLVLQVLSLNLCHLRSCNGREHIDCGVREGVNWRKYCRGNDTLLDLGAMQDQILARHNGFRNKIAGGLVDGFPPAIRMGTMVWNDTLADLAVNNVRQCTMRNDGCRNTLAHDFVGQNLAIFQYPKTVTVDYSVVFLKLVDSWYNEIQFATVNHINPFGRISAASPIDDFTQVIKDYASQIGCGAVKSFRIGNPIIFFACDYGMSNILSFPTYKVGPAGSGCEEGTHENYTNLCSTNEVFNVNTFWMD